MLKRANINWNAKQLCKMVQKNEIKFDNTVQRGYVWDTKRKSLLIHSMLAGYPIPPFYAAKSKNGYDMLDGKQRISSIVDFINGKFELTDIPEVESENADGSMEMVDINTLHFDEMEEVLRDELESYPFTVYYFEEITDEEITEMFFRLNNGKPLSAIELTRVKAKSMDTIQKIGRHELFKNALTEAAMSRYTNEDIVIKSYAMLHEEEPSLETKVIRPMMTDAEITEEDKRQLEEIYDRIVTIHGMIEDKKVAKRLLTRTHLISIVPIIWKSLQDGLSNEQTTKWASEFFAGRKSASVSDIYNQNAGSGSARKDAVRKRTEELYKSYMSFLEKESAALSEIRIEKEPC